MHTPHCPVVLIYFLPSNRQPKSHTKILQKIFPDAKIRIKRSNSFGDLEELNLYEIGNVEIAAPYTTLQEVN